MPTTLTEILLERASDARAHHAAITYLNAGEPALELRGADLLARAQRVAAALLAAGLKAGERVLLMLPSQSEFVDAFFGTMWAGAVPVPLSPPMFVARQFDIMGRFFAIAQNARPSCLITSAEIAPMAAEIAWEQMPGLRVVSSTSWISSTQTCVAQRPADLAFLQYTSGSTGTPKGVALSHDNVLSNITAIGRAVQFCPDDVGVSWLPMYHDMGLIGGLLSTLYWGASLISLSPIEFAKRPASWLRAISDHHATLSPAPNFAFRRCLRLPADEVDDLDLSSWRVAFNGAEPVDKKTLRSFAARFAASGFRTRTLYPVYGLAEHTLAVSFPPLGHEPVFDSVDRDVLAATSLATPVAPDHPAAISFVCVGRPLDGVAVEIRDGDACEPDGHVGEIVVKSRSVMTGYFENALATAEALDDGWLKTGDLGYMKDGFLYVTGRKKDLIIRAGCKYYPQDIESAASDVAGVKPGRIVSFSMDVDGEDHVVVLLEMQAPETGIEGRVAAAVAARVGFRPENVVVCEPSTLPMTSSGKVQRSIARQRFLSGALGPQRA